MLANARILDRPKCKVSTNVKTWKYPHAEKIIQLSFYNSK